MPVCDEDSELIRSKKPATLSIPETTNSLLQPFPSALNATEPFKPYVANE